MPKVPRLLIHLLGEESLLNDSFDGDFTDITFVLLYWLVSTSFSHRRLNSKGISIVAEELGSIPLGTLCNQDGKADLY